MPLTFPAHQAFILPLKRRWPHRFDGVALVVSAGTPDLGYTVTGLPVSSHSLVGVLGFAVPVALVYSFVLRRWGVPGLARLLPSGSVWARYGSIARRSPSLGTTVVSALVGAGSHVAVDSFTHRERQGSTMLGFDAVLFAAPVGDITIAKLLQYSGHTVGSALGVYLLWRLAQARPPVTGHAEGNRRSDANLMRAAAVVFVVGLLVTLSWATQSPVGSVFVGGSGLAVTLLAASVVTEWVAGRTDQSEGRSEYGAIKPGAGTEGTDPIETAGSDRSTGRLHGGRRLVIGVVLVMVAAAVGLPLWASLTYRSAVHDLHDELATIRIASAKIVDARIERCWNDVAPASVRALVPSDEQTVSEVVADYVVALESLGFEANGGVVGIVASRPRSDDLDDDIVTVAIDDANRHALLIADPFDADMVRCLPF